MSTNDSSTKAVERYLDMLRGLFAMRATATLSQELEGEIVEIHDLAWGNLSDEECEEVELGIEEIKAEFRDEFRDKPREKLRSRASTQNSTSRGKG